LVRKYLHVEKKVLDRTVDGSPDVAAIVTAMTEDEKPFLREAIAGVLSEPAIGQVVVCIDEKNNWLEHVISSFMKDPRLDIVRMPMMPIGSVRNKALTYVKHPWIAYCDGDDVWCKGKTIIQRNYANKTGADLVGAGHYLMNEQGKICAFGFSLHIPMPSSWLVRTEIMRSYPFNEKVFQGSDGEWWIRTANKIRKVKCPETLVRYRVRPHSVSSSSHSKKRKSKLVTLAGIPVLGSSIRFLTYCVWLCTRNQGYKWLKDWSEWIRLSDAKQSKNKL
jgi:glycosyltransferase involved in cell wall biosynthesis